ncbi:MAG TPA: crossover junction endodeoxyribonuclease RuvC [Gammaproteobacteria bacterium]|nr:crossover junction endodeoxyribonuclease RuvC [Gammaproteobacteria bacterium]
MLILGIDPGSITLGYGIIQQHRNTVTYVASGCIKVGKHEWPQRLRLIYDDLCYIIQQYKPNHVAIEKVFVHKNAASALKLGQARGAAIVAAASHDLLISEYSAREVKQAVVGYGNAEKSQIQHMIKAILNLNEVPATDAADALAVALCHGNTRKLVEVT